MSAGMFKLHHVNVTVGRDVEDATKKFYSSALGLEEVPKPEGSRKNEGAWYQLGDLQLHLSLEDDAGRQTSTRHVCFVVEDLTRTEEHLKTSRVEILPDPRPVAGTNRFYVRDPGGNLIEIAERKRP